MRNSLLALVATLAALCVSPGCKKSEQSALSGEPVLLQVKWPVGNRYVYRLDLDQQSLAKIPQFPKPIAQSMNMAMTYAISVLKENPDGGRELEVEFVATELEIKTGDQVMMTFDSKETAANESGNPAAAAFRNIVGSKVRMETDTEGKLIKVIGAEEWVAKIAGEPGDPMAEHLSSQFNDSFLRQIADFGRGFASHPVRVGETWPFKIELPAGKIGNLLLDSKVTFKGRETHADHECAILHTKGTIKGTGGSSPGAMGNMSMKDGTIDATSWFDPALGALVDSSGDQVLQLQSELPSPGGSKTSMSIDLKQKVSVKLVELGQTKS